MNQAELAKNKASLVPSLYRKVRPENQSVMKSMIEDINEAGTWAKICGDPLIRKNVILIVFTWATSNFAYYLINFQLNNVPGDIFTNVFISDGAEVASYIVSVILIEKLGLIRSFMFCLACAILGGVLLLILDP